MSKYHDFYEAIASMLVDDCLVWKTDRPGQTQKALEMWKRRNWANQKKLRVVCTHDKVYVIRTA